jgi:hypothetical protein
MNTRIVTLVGAALVLVCGGVYALGPARLTLFNDGLVLDHSLGRGLAALLAAAAASVLAVALPRRPIRALAGATAVAALLLATQRLVERVEVGGEALVRRGPLGSQRIPWGAVSGFDPLPDAILVRGGGFEVRLPTAGLPPAQREALERAIVRRLRGARPGG